MRIIGTCLLAALLAAYGQAGGPANAAQPPAAAPAARGPAAPATAPRAAQPDSTAAKVNLINNAQLTGQTPQPPAAGAGRPSAQAQPSPAIIKAEVLLDRAHASPGVIDGLVGSNLERAVTAFEQMNGLTTDGRLTSQVWAKLTQVSSAPVAGLYKVTAADVAGPFYPDYGENMVAAAKLKATGYDGPEQELAARFHMSQSLLEALNPKADYKHAGAEIVVALPEVQPLAPVARIEVDKASNSLRAYDDQNRLIASFPVTVGSVEHRSPSGSRKVVDIQYNPIYTYDPSKLTWGPKSHGKFSIQPGPNNPVGLVWIGLNAPGYGIHGAPSPSKIGKTESHGCVRMTNWDALLLAHAVKKGDQVVFVDHASPNASSA